MATTISFTALSYKWGSDSAAFSIIIHGKGLRIGRNLYDFFLRYRDVTCLSRGRLRETEDCWKQHSDWEYML
jgi:hypothetical protein